MINSKRVNKLRRNVYKIKGNPAYSKFIVQAKEGLYLFDSDKVVIHHKEKYSPIDKPVEGLQLLDCSEYSIDSILIVGDGKSEPVVIEDAIPFAYDIAEGYLEDSCNPFRGLGNEQLKKIVAIEL